MKRTLEVCAISVFLAAGASFAQTGETNRGDAWTERMERGQELERAANYNQASAAYRDAVKIAEPFGSGDRRLLGALNSLGLAYDKMGRFADGERCIRRALAVLAQADANSKPDRALLLTNLALLRREQGQLSSAEVLFNQAIAIETEVFSPGDPRVMLANAGLAELVLLSGRYPEAEKLVQDSLRVFEKQPERWRLEIAILLGDLGVVRDFQGRHDEAIALFRRSIEMIENELGPRHPMLLRPLVNLARVSASEAMFRRALTIAEESLGSEHPTCIDVLKTYAGFLRANGQTREAKVLEARAQESARRNGSSWTVDASDFRPK
jgi:tetratricopeptide (TPR) repeat protein